MTAHTDAVTIPPMTAPIRVDARGPVTVVTMDDGKANALSPTFMGALRDTVREAAGSAGAIVLARVGRVVFGAWEPKTGAVGSLTSSA